MNPVVDGLKMALDSQNGGNRCAVVSRVNVGRMRVERLTSRPAVCKSGPQGIFIFERYHSLRALNLLI